MASRTIKNADQRKNIKLVLYRLCVLFLLQLSRSNVKTNFINQQNEYVKISTMLTEKTNIHNFGDKYRHPTITQHGEVQ